MTEKGKPLGLKKLKNRPIPFRTERAGHKTAGLNRGHSRWHGKAAGLPKPEKRSKA